MSYYRQEHQPINWLVYPKLKTLFCKICTCFASLTSFFLKHSFINLFSIVFWMQQRHLPPAVWKARSLTGTLNKCTFLHPFFPPFVTFSFTSTYIFFLLAHSSSLHFYLPFVTPFVWRFSIGALIAKAKSNSSSICCNKIGTRIVLSLLRSFHKY